MSSDLMAAFHIGGAGLGNLTATFFYTYLFTQLYVGVLLDHYGVRYLSTFALLIATVGVYCFARAESLWFAQMARMFMGVGAAFATVSYMKVASTYFAESEFAFVGGLLATAAMLGAIFGEAPLSLLVGALGWRLSLVICALLGLGIALCFFAIIRDRSPLVAHGSTSTSAISLRAVCRVLCCKQNWVLAMYSGLAFSPVAVFGGLWGNLFLEQVHHVSKTAAASLVSFIFAGLGLGGPILGWISDKLRNRRLIMFLGVLLSLCSISIVIYLVTFSFAATAILLFLFGFGTGGFMLGFAVARESNEVALAATVIALINTGDALFGAYTEPLIGKFLDMQWGGKLIEGAHYFSLLSYQKAFLLLPLYLLIAGLLIFCIKENKKLLTATVPTDSQL
eukprot:TRINITY_DN47584_c0_g1_i1.p1 TRINITY_DN47584_c0_g1~~TRINITY_DN47584_c0_g1_i1.p1  ORF type:complete len:394 (+),score=-102.71 TRINITY_DN47584_c0_g1_i1:160-1341(+)